VTVVPVGAIVDGVAAGASVVPGLVGGLVVLEVATGKTIVGVVVTVFLVERLLAELGLDGAEVSFGSTAAFGLLVDVVAVSFRIPK